MAETRTVARPYAEAVFRLAQPQQALARWSEMFGLLAAVVADPRVARVVADPRVARDHAAGLVLEICRGRLDAAAANFVRLLAENRRLGLAPEIAALYEELRAAAEARIEAVVRSAYELEERQVEGLRQALGRRLGREVRVRVELDRSLLGGVVIRAGDLVIDGSVRGRLAVLASHLSH
jgi:F-type H+-transporting ATPase subunit delta